MPLTLSMNDLKKIVLEIQRPAPVSHQAADGESKEGDSAPQAFVTLEREMRSAVDPRLTGNEPLSLQHCLRLMRWLIDKTPGIDVATLPQCSVFRELYALLDKQFPHCQWVETCRSLQGQGNLDESNFVLLCSINPKLESVLQKLHALDEQLKINNQPSPQYLTPANLQALGGNLDYFYGIGQIADFLERILAVIPKMEPTMLQAFLLQIKDRTWVLGVLHTILECEKSELKVRALGMLLQLNADASLLLDVLQLLGVQGLEGKRFGLESLETILSCLTSNPLIVPIVKQIYIDKLLYRRRLHDNFWSFPLHDIRRSYSLLESLSKRIKTPTDKNKLMFFIERLNEWCNFHREINLDFDGLTAKCLHTFLTLNHDEFEQFPLQHVDLFIGMYCEIVSRGSCSFDDLAKFAFALAAPTGHQIDRRQPNNHFIFSDPRFSGALQIFTQLVKIYHFINRNDLRSKDFDRLLTRIILPQPQHADRVVNVLSDLLTYIQRTPMKHEVAKQMLDLFCTALDDPLDRKFCIPLEHCYLALDFLINAHKEGIFAKSSELEVKERLFEAVMGRLAAVLLWENEYLFEGPTDVIGSYLSSLLPHVDGVSDGMAPHRKRSLDDRDNHLAGACASTKEEHGVAVAEEGKAASVGANTVSSTSTSKPSVFKSYYDTLPGFASEENTCAAGDDETKSSASAVSSASSSSSSSSVSSASSSSSSSAGGAFATSSSSGSLSTHSFTTTSSCVAPDCRGPAVSVLSKPAIPNFTMSHLLHDVVLRLNTNEEDMTLSLNALFRGIEGIVERDVQTHMQSNNTVSIDDFSDFSSETGLTGSPLAALDGSKGLIGICCLLKHAGLFDENIFCQLIWQLIITPDKHSKEADKGEQYPGADIMFHLLFMLYESAERRNFTPANIKFVMRGGIPALINIFGGKDDLAIVAQKYFNKPRQAVVSAGGGVWAWPDDAKREFGTWFATVLKQYPRVTLFFPSCASGLFSAEAKGAEAPNSVGASPTSPARQALSVECGHMPSAGGSASASRQVDKPPSPR